MLKLRKKGSFSAAHHLTHYEGKCSSPHGHTWYWEVEVVGELNEEDGLLMDFNKIEEIMNEFDHRDINLTVVFSPTCECLARYFQLRLKQANPALKYTVTLWESDMGSVTYSD